MHSIFLSRAPAASQITKKVVVPVPKPVPFKDWPAWAKAISILKKDEDVGVGDTVHRVIGPAKSEGYKRWYQAVFGKSCGCARRQQEWNARFEYVVLK